MQALKAAVEAAQSAATPLKSGHDSQNQDFMHGE